MPKRRFERAAGEGPAPRRTPRYEVIRRTLLEDISSGRYPVGSKLPTEVELCAAFETSRHTMREAIRSLTEQGLIMRRPGAGTVVLRRSPPVGFTQEIGALPDLLAFIKNARIELIDSLEVRAGKREIELLRTRRGEVWHLLIALKRLRQAKRPLAYMHVYVHRDHPALRGVVDRGGAALHEFIETTIGERIVVVEQEFSAKPLDEQEARALDLPQGYAGFLIVRRYLAASGLSVLITSTVFPYERMRYVTSLRQR